MFKVGQKVVFKTDGTRPGSQIVVPQENEIVTINYIYKICTCGCGSVTYNLVEYKHNRDGKDQFFPQVVLRPIDNSFADAVCENAIREAKEEEKQLIEELTNI